LSHKFIYFDLDDTLLDHRAAEVSALSDVHREFEVFTNTSPRDLTDTYHEVNSEQWEKYSRGEVTRQQLQRNRFEQTLQKLDLDDSRYEEIGSYYMQCYRKHWKWIEGAEVAYQKVSQHFPVGILTNGFSETQQKKFEKFGFYNSARHVVVSEDVGALKPDPRVFKHATDLAGYDADQILYVGDSYTSDIQGGGSFGWNTAWFTESGSEEQQDQADFVFSNFENLCKYLRL
jgi:putative hydrolase of the HAD superfamily